MGNLTTEKALKVLCQNVIDSSLGENEKNALIKLIDIIHQFYIDKYDEIVNDSSKIDHVRLSKLTSIVTDYIVTISDTISGKNDPYSIVNIIYKELNYDNSKGKFKRKRLI